jgi:hypothetical protein
MAVATMLNGVKLIMKAETYDFKGAKEILQRKGLLNELNEIIKNVTQVDHRLIQDAFIEHGWEKEYPIHHGVSWTWDAYKRRVPVSIELSLIDAVHRDLLRILLWKKEDKVDAMIYITSTFKEPKFQNVRRDLEIFKSLVDVPIFLMGLPES